MIDVLMNNERIMSRIMEIGRWAVGETIGSCTIMDGHDLVTIPS